MPGAVRAGGAAGDLTDELTTVVKDFRWLDTVLRLDDPAAVEADLSHTEGPLTETLRRAVTQSAHLLRPVPRVDGALGVTLLSRLHGYPELADWVQEATATTPPPAPLPCVAHAGHTAPRPAPGTAP